MYVDEKRQGEARDVVHPSLEGFIEWLRRQEPTQEYDWSNSGVCACAQYAKAKDKLAGWFLRAASCSSDWYKLNRLAFDEPRNFGSLLQRCLDAYARERAAA